MPLFQYSFRAFALFLALGASARASVISDTLDGNTGDTAKSLSSKGAAGSFTADATGNLGEVEIDLSRTGSTGSVVITLNDNNSGLPGTSVDTIATIQASNIPAIETLYDFYNLSIMGLMPDATYWIEVSKVGSSAASANAYTSMTEPQTGTGQIYWSGGTSTYTTTFLNDCVSSDNSCDGNSPSANYSFNESIATPEPATVAIVGVGLAGIGWIRRRTAKLAKT